jgi:hypothetical protein
MATENFLVLLVPSDSMLSLKVFERANWRANICDAKARAFKKLNIIKSLSHTSWGLDKKTLLNAPNDHTANYTIWRVGVRISNEGGTEKIRPGTS